MNFERLKQTANPINCLECAIEMEEGQTKDTKVPNIILRTYKCKICGAIRTVRCRAIMGNSIKI